MYTTDYFIRKFEDIPENKWTTFTTGLVAFEGNLLGIDREERCALGHCGGYKSEEAIALSKLFYDFFKDAGLNLSNFNPDHDTHLVYWVNDDTFYIPFESIPVDRSLFSAVSPKDRILKVLYKIRDGESALKEVNSVLSTQHELA